MGFKPKTHLLKPKVCPDCECPIIWTGENRGLCACNGDAYDEAYREQERQWHKEKTA